MSFDTENANYSGKGPDYPVPEEVADRFNWGAFFLSWIWGLGNKTYIIVLFCVLMFIVNVIFSLIAGKNELVMLLIGIAQFVMGILFGIEGNRWAWQNKHFESIEHFESYQKKWAIAGVIIMFLPVILVLVGILSAGLSFIGHH